MPSERLLSKVNPSSRPPIRYRQSAPSDDRQVTVSRTSRLPPTDIKERGLRRIIQGRYTAARRMDVHGLGVRPPPTTKAPPNTNVYKAC